MSFNVVKHLGVVTVVMPIEGNEDHGNEYREDLVTIGTATVT
jgi:hypothetical protein